MINKDPAVIHPETLDLLVQLQQDPFLKDFFLAGGTALALLDATRFPDKIF